jgi:hypothetical protein
MCSQGLSDVFFKAIHANQGATLNSSQNKCDEAIQNMNSPMHEAIKKMKRPMHEAIQKIESSMHEAI